jgi:peptidoglycan/xylan/chitin deacetylase (PgdA/CDA1 family)
MDVENDLAAVKREVDSLRQSVCSLEEQRSKLELELDALQRDVLRLSNVARDLGCLGVMPEPKSSDPNRGVILMYHRVAILDLDPAQLCIGHQVFRAQMEHLARTREPMTLDALTEAVRSGRIPRDAVVITLDDGYADALVASEILCDLHLPATFFVNSNAGEETFHDLLARILLGPHSLPSTLEISVMGAQLQLSCVCAEERRAAFDLISKLGWSLSADGRRRLVEALRLWSTLDLTPRPDYRVLTPVELQYIANQPGHSVGAHTENHLFLPAQSRLVKIREIAANRRFLQDVTRKEVSSFSYPYGAFDEETVRFCRGLGFRSGVTVVGKPTRPWNDTLLLPRNEVKSQTIEEFERFVGALF